MTPPAVSDLPLASGATRCGAVLDTVGLPDRSGAPVCGSTALGDESGSRAVLRRRLVSRLDAALRWFYDVQEFTEEPGCVLRIAPGRTALDVRLADGSCVRRGSEVLELHLWNEHLLPKAQAAGLGRTSARRRQFETSLRELAAHLHADPSLGRIAALWGRAAFVPQNRIPQLLRAARSLGFETVEATTTPAWPTRLHDFCENFLLWALAWTFNPDMLRRQGVRRKRLELWMSREVLLARYGQAAHRRCEIGGKLPAPLRHRAAPRAVVAPANSGRRSGSHRTRGMLLWQRNG